MDLHLQFRRGHRIIGDLLKLSLVSILFAQLLATVVFPIAEAVLRQVQAVPTYVLPAIYSVHVLVGAYGLFGLNKIKDFIRLADLDEIEQQVKEYQEKLDDKAEESHNLEHGLTTLVSHSVAVQASLSVLQSLLTSDLSSDQTDEKGIERLLAPLIQLRTEALGFTADDLYNLAVYIYDEKQNLLRLRYRDCDNRIRRQDRSWRPGTGHVGLAFTQNRTIITENVADAPDILGPYVDTDNNQYVSIISTPIFSTLIGTAVPMGVLVITSDREGHFDRAYQTLAESFSILLAIYLSRHLRAEKGAVPWRLRRLNRKSL